MNNHFVEKHTISKKLCTQFVFLSVTGSPFIKTLFALCIILLLFGAVLVAMGSYDIRTFQIFILPMIGAPLIYFMLKRQAKLTYKRFLEIGGGQEPQQIVTVDDNITALKPDTNSTQVLEFTQIKHIYENKDIFILITAAKLGIIITKGGFIEGNAQEFKGYLYEKAINAKKHKSR